MREWVLWSCTITNVLSLAVVIAARFVDRAVALRQREFLARYETLVAEHKCIRDSIEGAARSLLALPWRTPQ